MSKLTNLIQKRRQLEETGIHVKKGAFHAWLGKSPDQPITKADIAKGKAAGGHAEKMAIFAQNFGHIGEENINEIKSVINPTSDIVRIHKPGHWAHGSLARVFHRFPDGKINAQEITSAIANPKTRNWTLHPHEYKEHQKAGSNEIIKESLDETLDTKMVKAVELAKTHGTPEEQKEGEYHAKVQTAGIYDFPQKEFRDKILKKYGKKKANKVVKEQLEEGVKITPEHGVVHGIIHNLVTNGYDDEKAYHKDNDSNRKSETRKFMASKHYKNVRRAEGSYDWVEKVAKAHKNWKNGLNEDVEQTEAPAEFHKQSYFHHMSEKAACSDCNDHEGIAHHATAAAHHAKMYSLKTGKSIYEEVESIEESYHQLSMGAVGEEGHEDEDIQKEYADNDVSDMARHIHKVIGINHEDAKKFLHHKASAPIYHNRTTENIKKTWTKYKGSMNEETVNEVSKALLGRYVDKAVGGLNGVASNAYKAGQSQDKVVAYKHWSKAVKRIVGVTKATKRLTK